MNTATDTMNRVVSRGNEQISAIGIAWRTIALWLALLVASAVAGNLVKIDLPMPPQDGPLTIMGAFLVVNGLIAIALSFVAARARVTGWRLAVLLFVAYFGIGSAMMQIETLYFNEAVQMPVPVVLALVEMAAIIGALVAIVGAILFRPAAENVAAVPSNMIGRVLLLAAIYVVLYYAAGFFIAWQSEAVRTYYSTMNIQFLPTVAFQIFRGTLWALIALFIVTRIKGTLASRAAIMGVLFAVLTAAQLLYPNPLIPWPVRQAHLIEVATSEAVYGIVATLVLLAGAARKPLAGNSAWRLIAGRA